MKALFVHSHRFFLKDNEYYTSGTLNNTLFERYFAVFEEVEVLARCEIIGNDKYNDKIIENNKVTLPILNLINAVDSFNYKQIFPWVKKAVMATDCVIARLPSVLGIIACYYALKLHKPWAVEVVGHAWDALWYHGSLKGKISAPILTFLTKTMVKKAPYVLYVTNNFLQIHYPTRGKSIACSNVELPIFDEEVLEKRLTKIDSKTYPIKIGLIGAMSSKLKGIDDAIKALSIARSQLPPFEFHVLGGGDKRYFYKLAVQKGLKEEVKFDGTLSSGKPVFDWLDQLDLYIQPSKTEGLPRALIEALSRGLPAIGSFVGGIPELLDEECIIKPGDINSLGKKIVWVLSNPSKQKELAMRNFKRAGEYSKTILDKRRTGFWREFRDYAVEQKRKPYNKNG
ncbi:MAG: glycosyltransferase family 4 protein [Thermoanaerobacterales bacterium]|nr:glycosyltransferase family 4 protein [Thermoanaerobacterales bacterium]